jgi:hypothetical protein
VLTAVILAALAVILLRRRPRLRLPAPVRRAALVLAGVAVLAAAPAAWPALVPLIAGLVLAAALTLAGSLGLVALAARHGAVVICFEVPGGMS